MKSYPDWDAIMEWNEGSPVFPISISKPVFLGDEKSYVREVLDSGWITQGKFVKRFEEGFAEFCNTKYAFACSSGTTALHLALLSMNISPGDVVIVPTISYIATANAVMYVGGRPFFSDVDLKSFCITPELLDETVKTAMSQGLNPVGVIPVHLFGEVCVMDGINNVCEEYGLWIVEDSAQAHGSVYAGRRSGSFGDAAAFSFYGNKTLTCGEGGIVTTNLDSVADLVFKYRGQYVSDMAYHHDGIGYNYRMTDLQAAIGLAQLETFSQHLNRRNQLYKRYWDRLIDKVTFQHLSAGSTPWLFAVLEEYRKIPGIETRPIFPAIHKQKPYKDFNKPWSSNYEVIEKGMCLPLHSEMNFSDVDSVCAKLLGDI